MIDRIHHLNVLVRDLEVAVERWQSLGLGPFQQEDLPQRGVRTARVDLGGTWLVLVQPLDPGSEPGLHLTRHGEGLFLISLACDDLESAETAVSRAGLSPGPVRNGLADWRVFDVADFGAGHLIVQFCVEGD